MAKITQKDVQKLGKLARLAVSDETAANFAGQLKEIIDYNARLQSVKVDGVETTDQVTGLTDVWREDKVVAGRYTRDDLLRNAPDTQDGFIKVKRVL